VAAASKSRESVQQAAVLHYSTSQIAAPHGDSNDMHVRVKSVASSAAQPSAEVDHVQTSTLPADAEADVRRLSAISSVPAFSSTVAPKATAASATAAAASSTSSMSDVTEHVTSVVTSSSAVPSLDSRSSHIPCKPGLSSPVPSAAKTSPASLASSLSSILSELQEAHALFHSVAGRAMDLLRRNLLSTGLDSGSARQNGMHALSAFERLVSQGDAAVRTFSDACRREQMAAAYVVARTQAMRLAEQAAQAAAALSAAKLQAEEAARLSADAQEQERAMQAELEALTSVIVDDSPVDQGVVAGTVTAVASSASSPAHERAEAPVTMIGALTSVTALPEAPTSAYTAPSASSLSSSWRAASAPVAAAAAAAARAVPVQHRPVALLSAGPVGSSQTPSPMEIDSSATVKSLQLVPAAAVPAASIPSLSVGAQILPPAAMLSSVARPVSQLSSCALMGTRFVPAALAAVPPKQEAELQLAIGQPQDTAAALEFQTEGGLSATKFHLASHQTPPSSQTIDLETLSALLHSATPLPVRRSVPVPILVDVDGDVQDITDERKHHVVARPTIAAVEERLSQSVSSSNWLLELDGPADLFPCGSPSGCQPTERERQEICCFVALRVKGVGYQLRVHYKGQPVRDNQWRSAKELRKENAVDVEAFIQEHKEHPWMVSTAPTSYGVSRDGEPERAAAATAAGTIAAAPPAFATPSGSTLPTTTTTTSLHFTRKRSAPSMKAGVGAIEADDRTSEGHADKKRRKSARQSGTSSFTAASSPLRPPPLLSFGTRGNRRAVVDVEIDRLMQRMCSTSTSSSSSSSSDHSLPLPVVVAHYLATCSVENWGQVHEKELTELLTKAAMPVESPSMAVASASPALDSVAALLTASSPSVSSSHSPSSCALSSSSGSCSPFISAGSTQAVSYSPPAHQVIVSTLHVRHEEGIEHWILLLIHMRSKEVLLVDSLPQEEELHMADDAMQCLQSHLLSHPTHRTLVTDYSWRCCYLGVQTDNFNCGVWMPVIWREWLKLTGAPDVHATLANITPPFCGNISIREERAMCADLLFSEETKRGAQTLVAAAAATAAAKD
jgi:hypothetical protein